MKHILALLFLCCAFNTQAQYNKEKLTNILTNGNTKNWSVKGTNLERPEKTYEFNKNGNLTIGKDDGQGKIISVADKWLLTTKDNIRWFLQTGKEVNELIISFEKNGTQYLKLTHRGTGKNTSVYYETQLHAIK